MGVATRGTVRLDIALVQRGLARSRTHAAALIDSGSVRIDHDIARKAATPVDEAAALFVDPGEDWASRGAHKLIGALDRFGIDPAGLTALDAGASTGGFTDVLLRRGAAVVAAVDVGHGQLRPHLAADPRVHVHDGVNLHALDAEQAAAIRDSLGGPADVIVADLSFISLTLVLDALTSLAADGADLVPMIKPQFEVGRGNLGAGGVVRDLQRRADAVRTVVDAAAGLGWGAVDIVASPLPGPSGNVEYFAHLRRGASADPAALVAAAVTEGPS